MGIKPPAALQGTVEPFFLGLKQTIWSYFALQRKAVIDETF
jgi:hypothetical protein